MMALDMVQVPCAVSSHVGGVRARSRRAVHVLVRVDCRRRSTVIKSSLLPSTSVARWGEIAKGTIQPEGTLSCGRDGVMMALFILANEDVFV
jgi:hypothetical protein